MTYGTIPIGVGPTSRGRLASLVLALAAASLTAGCGTTATPAPEPATPAPTEAANDPIGLVGLWRVSGATGESAGTWLRLSAGGVTLWRECGMLGGMWRAGSHAFIAKIFEASQGCASDSFDEVGWLDATTSYRSTDGGWELVDADGGTTASLSVDGAPEPIENADPSFARPPVVDDALRAAFATPAPLPDSLAPAGAEEIAGRWVPAEGSFPSDPHAIFATSGSWSGSDGCNGNGGRWLFDGDGALLTTSGPSTLIGCDGAPVPDWVGGASLAGFDGPQLVLLGRDAVELGRLERADD